MKPLLRKLTDWKADALHAVYPEFCLSCDSEMLRDAAAICPVCLSDLHFTYFEDYDEPTSLDKLFWGRLQLSATYAMLHFEEGTSTQSVLHSLKYKDRPDVAKYFGAMTGRRVAVMKAFADLDALVPVPLHPKKEFIRGYNQSEMIARGMAAELDLPIDGSLLRRVAFTESQTRKDKLSRWENMQNRFRGKETERSYSHVAIVDDVITTGSTLEMCANELQTLLPECRISLISLAVAR
jgi:competence protein ComFC